MLPSPNVDILDQEGLPTHIRQFSSATLLQGREILIWEEKNNTYTQHRHKRFKALKIENFAKSLGVGSCKSPQPSVPRVEWP